ncbi:Dolichol kinase sec59 [Lecanosticta acicola]|uniref:dolichol kinase n=1 Tax=Lecanosticta acicola TaxID=111012 RepID=A0AAI8YZ11_9PEZI|nr:Dolichol kinase sec59 [Lecanosticta acicola]
MAATTEGQADVIEYASSSFAHGNELEGLRREFTRTPRPYLYSHEGERGEDKGEGEEKEAGGSSSGGESEEEKSSSQSGTEADDERPYAHSFVKALPPSSARPRKGLKTGEEREEVLLTPSQLDEKERKVQGYFEFEKEDEEEDEQRQEREEVRRRRYGEFVRRTSEVALMGLILVIVLCGKGVGQTAWFWKRELLCHFGTIALLVLAYPIKLSIVDTQAPHTKLSQRFRVPASFDPATVLYPPLLPVLVALSVAPANPAVILPNLILGLASLPQRLFPRSSRLGQINTVHWLVSILPLIVAENTAWPSKLHPAIPYFLKAPQGLSPETLVSLYPLHHALMVPLHYLTTTSLLISELHLLSAALINLLLLAESPQAVILKACLWVGGVSLFVICGPVLHWNVQLARIPRWKLRRPGHTAEERKSLVDAVSDLISLQRAAGAFTSSGGVESDADEDLPSRSIKHKSAKSANGMPKLNMAGLNLNGSGPRTALERSATVSTQRVVSTVNVPPSPRRRRNTVPGLESREEPKSQRPASNRRKTKNSSLLWCLQLTPEQALKRKWYYASFTYLMIWNIIIGPVQWYVSDRAFLRRQNPVGWAAGYLLGQIPWARGLVLQSDLLKKWVPLPPLPDWSNLTATLPVDMDVLRNEIGRSNTRLLLIVYWIAVLIAGLLAVFSLTAFVEVDTRRKVFHGVMVAMFVPTVFIDPCYCSLALSLVLAIFLLLEVIRAGQVPPLGNAIGRFVAPYVDGRDLRGPVVVSHVFLLIGCAVPLWFSLASMPRTAGDSPWGEWELAGNEREIAMVAGVICVGMGDAAASLIGRRYGRRKWLWVGGKSLEGSAAFALAVTVGLLAAKGWEGLGCWNNNNSNNNSDRITGVVAFWGWGWSVVVLGKAAVCACVASFLEAVLTGANDNVVVPVALWLVVRGVRL